MDVGLNSYSGLSKWKFYVGLRLRESGDDETRYGGSEG